MRCPGCQTENDPGAKFCTECGLPLPAAAAARPEPPRNDPAPAAPVAPGGPQPAASAAVSHKKGKPRTIVLIVLAAVIVLLCVLFLMKGRNKPEQNGAGRGDAPSPVGTSDTTAEDASTSAPETTAPDASEAESTAEITGPNGAAERDFTNLFGYWRDLTGAWELYVTADGLFTFSDPDGLFNGYVDRESGGYAMYLSDGARLNGDAVLSFPEGMDDLLVYRSQFFEVSLDLTHYDGYPATQRTVWISPPGELLSQYPAHEAAVIDDTASATQALLLSDYPVRDLKVLSLELADVSQDGKITFSEREMFSMPVLFPSRPLLLTVTFEGTIPTRGISYVDADGVTRRFSLSLSGFDGSIMMTEF